MIGCWMLDVECWVFSHLLLPFLHCEFVNCARPERLAGSHDRRRIFGMIDGIRHVLCFETKTRVFVEHESTCAGGLSIEPVAREELHRWFGGLHFQHATGSRLFDTRAPGHFAA